MLHVCKMVIQRVNLLDGWCKLLTSYHLPEIKRNSFSLQLQRVQLRDILLVKQGYLTNKEKKHNQLAWLSLYYLKHDSITSADIIKKDCNGWQKNIKNIIGILYIYMFFFFFFYNKFNNRTKTCFLFLFLLLLLVFFLFFLLWKTYLYLILQNWTQKKTIEINIWCYILKYWG